MSNDDSVTLWIEELRNADQAAARNLWNHFVSRLYELGRKKLRPETRRVYDEEDAAQSAFHSVCAGIAAGRFPALTARKVAHRHRHDQQQSRDVNRNLSDSIFVKSHDHSPPAEVRVVLLGECGGQVRSGDEDGGEVLALNGLSPADGGGMGVCLSSRCRDWVVIRRVGRSAWQTRVVYVERGK